MKSSLPEDFAMRLLDKEIELESNTQISTLTDLVDLYRQGIEYYEDIKSQKYWDLQERLQKILMRPEILSMMKTEHQRSKAPSKSRPRASTHSTVNPSQKRQQFETNKKAFNTQLQDSGIVQVPNVTKLATKLVENQDSHNKQTTQKTVNNLKTQDLSLEERLRMRKKRTQDLTPDTSMTKEFQPSLSPVNENSTSSSFFFEFQDDKSSDCRSVNLSFQNFQKSDELETLIEKIMEESYVEKTEKVTAIKVKYETQINEYSGQGSFYEEIIKNLKEQMNDEIREVSLELDSKRKQAISKAKAEFIEIF